MFERFTDSARRAMVLANQEARDRGQNFIGGGHILLGIWGWDREVAGGLFEDLGLASDEFTSALEAEAGQGPSDEAAPPLKSPPFTPRAKKSLEYSLREALQLGHNWIGPGHMVLGLLYAGTPQALVDHLDVAEARNVVAAWESRPQGAPRTPSKSKTAGFSRVLEVAMANPKPLKTSDLLGALVSVENTLANKVLKSLGVTSEKLQELISSIEARGTLDETPQAEYEVRIGEHTIRVDHPESRNLLRRILEEDPPLAARIREAIERRAKWPGN